MADSEAMSHRDGGGPLIAGDAELAVACGRWSAAGVIGVDTEFFRERTYYPLPALVQVADADGVALVDPLEISDFTPLAELLTDQSVVKVMHACGEDLDVLERLTGATPRHVFDTQRAGAFAGHGFSLGYRGLVGALLDVVLDKGETRSDWLRRPLSPAQLRYAALDVVHLLPMHERLSRDLEALGRTAWLTEELEHHRRARVFEKQPQSAYLKVRGRGALSPEHHAVLRALSQWRETEAMARDLPRRHLLTDEVLLTLATIPAPDAGSLGKIRGVSQRAGVQYGHVVMACIDTARSQGPGDTDAPAALRPHADTLKRLKRIVRRVADASKLPPELVASRRGLEALLISVVTDDGDIPREFRGWRFDVVTKTLVECIHDSC